MIRSPAVKRTPEFTSFAEFWPYYLGEHQRPGCRVLHYAGALALVAVAVWAIATADWRPLLILPLAGYGPAWLGHFVIEHNHPATWSYVSWSLRGEWRMLWLALRGRLRAELARCATLREPS